MTDLTSLAGRAALVTGASRGIGYGVAAALLARGASVTITGRRAPELDAAASGLAAGAGVGTGRVLAVAGNVGDAAHRAAAEPVVLEVRELRQIVEARDNLPRIPPGLPGPIEPERAPGVRVEMPLDDLSHPRVERGIRLYRLALGHRALRAHQPVILH